MKLKLIKLRKEYMKIFKKYTEVCDEYARLRNEVKRANGQAKDVKRKELKSFEEGQYAEANNTYDEFLEKVDQLPKNIKEEFWSLIGI